MDTSPQSFKRRRLNPSTAVTPHDERLNGRIDTDSNGSDQLPTGVSAGTVLSRVAELDGSSARGEYFNVYEDGDQDELVDLSTPMRSSTANSENKPVIQNGVVGGRVVKSASKTTSPQSRRDIALGMSGRARTATTPSKSSKATATGSPILSGTTRVKTTNGSPQEEHGSPPPSLTPSRRNRIWPREFTNRGQQEAEVSQRQSDPVIASPRSMMGRLTSAGKAVASRFRLGVHGIEPVQERGVSLKDLDLTRSAQASLAKRKAASGPPAALRIEESEQGMIRGMVLEKLTGTRPIPLIGLDDEYKKVYQVAEQTVTAGEGNSMLVIGARGSGKTTLMNKIVREVARDNESDFHVIRLNGFIHTDDKLALREIWRQLGREMEVEDDGSGKSYADTLARLLALLSHPSELVGEETESIAKAVIFILDEFDLFASHPRQTLLYNLFDIAQSRKAPIAVFGLTTRIDVAESLEKRVKSRFSHRYVHLCQAPNLPGFLEVCRAALTIEDDELSFEEKARLLPDTATPQQSTPSKPKAISPLKIWNATIDALLREENFMGRYITPHLYFSKSIPAVLSDLHLPIALAPAPSLPLNPSHFHLINTTGPQIKTELIAQVLPPDSNLQLLRSLPMLTLSLLIAAARCTIIHDSPFLNFRIAYAEYMSLASKARISAASAGALATGAKIWGREVARGAWEGLVRLGLLIPAQGVMNESVEAEVGEKGMVRVDVALEEIAPACKGSIEKQLEKWCRQI